MNLWSTLTVDGLAPKTVRLYMATATAAETWFADRGRDLRQASVADVAEYVATIPATWSSRKLLRSALGRYWAWCGHPRPPLGVIRIPPKPTMVCLALEEDDARILAKAARARGDLKGLAVLLGLYQAMRREEIASARWAHFDDDGWATITGKGEKQRRIPVHAVVTESMAAMEHHGEHIFPGRFGGPVTPATVCAWPRRTTPRATCGPCRRSPATLGRKPPRATPEPQGAASKRSWMHSTTEAVAHYVLILGFGRRRKRR